MSSDAAFSVGDCTGYVIFIVMGSLEGPIITTLVSFGLHAMVGELLRFIQTHRVRSLDLPQGRLRPKFQYWGVGPGRDDPVRVIRNG